MWYTRDVNEVFQELKSGSQGLNPSDIPARLAQHGPNALEKRGGRTPLKILWEQFTATMVLILIGAGVLAMILGDRLEAIAIFAIVILFGVMGFIQEYRAEQALAALKKLAIPRVRVRRGGHVDEIPSVDLVPGDIILVESGNLIPADCRIVQSHNCRVQEAALTGEAEGVDKQVEPLTGGDLPLGDRVNMLYMGTLVSYGRAEAVVVATGMNTELGKIAGLIQDVEEGRSPLQKRLENLGKILAGVGVGISALIAVIGTLAGQKITDMLILGVSMAVAIIPEGLPAVLTITLALGARRMFDRHALIRKLPAVETLGSVTVICSDKTGTLTQNRMTVVSVHGYEGSRELDSNVADATGDGVFSVIQALGALCNDAHSSPSGITGDPTETCLLELAVKQGWQPADLNRILPRRAELSFDSGRKRMSTLHSLDAVGGKEGIPAGLDSVLKALAALPGFDPSGSLMAVKGSPDGLLNISTSVLTGKGLLPMDEAARTRLDNINSGLAGKGMRVLGLAFRLLPGTPGRVNFADEDNLVFAGLVGIIDPPRPEVREAMSLCRTAGIRPIMITGDHPLTARAIAADLGMDITGETITGRDLENMEDSELLVHVRQTSVFARVAPEHKLRIVNALQNQHQVVAMTGDGVNDAPALRKADIGVAMGITGTDVSKEASQMVLTDDNFASIVSAVEQGRVIYDNIRKYIKFSLGGNAGKVLVLLLLPLVTGVLSVTGFFGQGEGITPVMVGLSALQLLWLNLLCDGLLSVGLGVEHPERGVMQRQPVKPKSGIFDGDMTSYVLINGLVIGLVALATGLWQWMNPLSSDNAERIREVQTAIFMTLYFVQMWSVFSVRTGKYSVFRSGMKQNALVWLMVFFSLGLQFASLYVPFLSAFLGTVRLPLSHVFFMMALGAVMIPIFEIQKAVQRRFYG